MILVNSPKESSDSVMIIRLKFISMITSVFNKTSFSDSVTYHFGALTGELYFGREAPAEDAGASMKDLLIKRVVLV